MARIASIKWNDTGNGDGVNVSVFMQGCHFHCKGCFNSSTWDFEGGEPATSETIFKVIDGIGKNGVKRNLSILGGEPLADENRIFVSHLVQEVRKAYPDIKIWLWTGYEWDELIKDQSLCIHTILAELDYLIVGRFKLEERDLTLRYMGSRNQKLLKKGIDF